MTVACTSWRFAVAAAHLVHPSAAAVPAAAVAPFPASVPAALLHRPVSSPVQVPTEQSTLMSGVDDLKQVLPVHKPNRSSDSDVTPAARRLWKAELA
jgi:hypothetical protein